MCDYSLHNVASRPAKVGDKLVSTKFSNSFTRGFAAVGEPNVAVCLLPGTEVAFEKEVEYVNILSLLPNRKLGQKLARFRHINKDQPNAHRDALEFPDGHVLLLTGYVKASTRLCCSCRSLPAASTKRTNRTALLPSPDRAARIRVCVA
jgi:hypothetical protein